MRLVAARLQPRSSDPKVAATFDPSIFALCHCERSDAISSRMVMLQRLAIEPNNFMAMCYTLEKTVDFCDNTLSPVYAMMESDGRVRRRV